MSSRWFFSGRNIATLRRTAVVAVAWCWVRRVVRGEADAAAEADAGGMPALPGKTRELWMTEIFSVGT